MSAEYRHYFCKPCGQQQQTATETDPALSERLHAEWKPIPEGKFECGDWSKDEMKFKGHGCGKSATIQVVSQGGTPVQHIRPN